jgi:glycosyltransferase involved in cell wall biosynthesis
MPRTVHFGSNLLPAAGGVYTTLCYFIDTLERLDWGRKVVSFDYEGHEADPIASAQTLRLRPVNGYLGRAYGYAGSRAGHAAAEFSRDADIVFAHLLYRHHVVVAGQVATGARKPLVIVPHGSLDPYCYTYRRLRKLLWMKAYSRLWTYGSFLFATEQERRKAIQTLPFLGTARSAVIEWPVVFDGGPRDPVPLLGALAANGRLKLLYAARLHPMKRIIETVVGFRNVNPGHWDLIVAGPKSDVLDETAVRRAAGSEYARSIHYVGFLNRPQLGWAAERCHASVLLSHRENFGHSVAEAMCAGLPVAISDGVDIFDHVVTARAGTVSTIRTQEDVNSALHRFLTIPQEELRRMGLRGKEHALRAFSVERFRVRLQSLLTEQQAASTFR